MKILRCNLGESRTVDLSAPIKLASSPPGVEANNGVEGSPRQILFCSTAFRSSSDMRGHAHIDAKEAEAEIRAQIARAKALGIQPTHLDSHMGTLYKTRLYSTRSF